MRKRFTFIGFMLVFALLIVGCSSSGSGSGTDSDGAGENGEKLKVLFMPKALGNSYFGGAAEGAEAISDSLDIDFKYDGPTKNDASEQVSMINGYISKGYDVLAVSALDSSSLVPVLQGARNDGIKVITWDSDIDPEARDYFVNPASSEGIGLTLAKLTSENFGESEGVVDVAIITSTPNDPQQNDWIDSIEKAIENEYSNLNIVTIVYDEAEPDTSMTVTADLLKSYKNLKAIIAPNSISLPSAAAAIDKAGRSGEVYITGLADPDVVREHVEKDTIESFVLWSVRDMGELTMHVAKAVSDGTMPESGTFKAGELGEFEVDDDNNVMLGLPTIYTKDNIDDY